MTNDQTTYTLEEYAQQLNLQPDATLRFGNGKVTSFITPECIHGAIMFKGLTAETLIEAIKFFNMGFKDDTRSAINESIYKSIGNTYTNNTTDMHVSAKEVDVRIITNRRKTFFGNKLDVLIVTASKLNSSNLYIVKLKGGGLLI